MILNQGQQATLDSAMYFLLSPDERHMVIKGRAGTGKSTLTKALVSAIHDQAELISIILQQKEQLPLYLTATTNKAAKVLADMSAEAATTIHSLLGLMPRRDYKTGELKLTRGGGSKVITDSVIIIDEAFWLCPNLLKFLDQGTQNCKIIFIGDPFQCAPIRQKHSPVQDLQCRTEELTQVMRNGGNIQLLGEHWRNSVITETFSDFVINDPSIIWADDAQFRALIDTEFNAPVLGENTCKIIGWTNAQVAQYSHYVRNLRGLPSELTQGEFAQVNNSLSKRGITTDTVVKIETIYPSADRYGLQGRMFKFHGLSDLFFVPLDSLEFKARLKQLASRKEWPLFFEMQESIPDLRAIHSCTVHKAQGSTYENIFIDLPDIGKCNIASDVARMMHVAVTRAKSKVIFRGELPPKYRG